MPLRVKIQQQCHKFYGNCIHVDMFSLIFRIEEKDEKQRKNEMESVKYYGKMLKNRNQLEISNT